MHSGSDNATVEGIKSVATNNTRESMETVKASNRRPQQPVNTLPAVSEGSFVPAVPATTMTSNKPIGQSNSSQKKSKTWQKFKKALKPFKMASSSNLPDDTKHGNEQTDNGNRTRTQSYDNPLQPPLPLFQRSKSDAVRAGADPSALDSVVRGRLDGLDVMTLGCALWTSTAEGVGSSRDAGENPWDDTRYSVTGRSTLYSPADMVKDMLWTSGGRAKPEIILEGFSPGPEDRWTVQIEMKSSPKLLYEFTSLDILASSTSQTDELTESTGATTTDEFDSPMLSSHKLWTTLWGSDPIPSGQPNRELITQVGNPSESHSNSASKSSQGSQDDGLDDPVLSLAANSNVPIDLDEDTFIVTTREHLTAIQQIAAVPLSEGRFEAALCVMEKLLQGLGRPSSPEQRYLRGSTQHNIGLIHLWEGNYAKANAYFLDAYNERVENLPIDHLDLVVTQCRQAQCHFALGRFSEAADILENCLKIAPADDAVIRAKILNNLGLVCYHQNEVSKALRCLAHALEQQREWLDGPVKRESIVYEASVSLSNMGKLYLDRTDFALGNSMYEEALLLQTSIFHKENPIVMQSFVNLAWSRALVGQNRSAFRLLESCERLQTESFGKDSAAAVETSGWIAHLCAKAERYNEALPIYQRIRQWQKQHIKKAGQGGTSSLFSIAGMGSQSSSHPSIRLVKDCIKVIEEKSGPKTTLSMWL